MPSDSIKVFETFPSIQGESSRAGLPCFFIRLAGCNLDCAYCDTREARNPASGKEFSVDGLLSIVRESGLRLVEVTGGEPLAQARTPELCARLVAEGFEVMVETNGSIDVSPLPPETIRIVDFKTPSSGEHDRMLPSNFKSLRRHDEVKFVVSSREDYLFSLERMREFDIVSQTPNVLFSPVSGILEPAELAKWMLHDKVPARLNLQLHKIVWGGDAKGV